MFNFHIIWRCLNVNWTSVFSIVHCFPFWQVRNDWFITCKSPELVKALSEVSVLPLMSQCSLCELCPGTDFLAALEGNPVRFIWFPWNAGPCMHSQSTKGTARCPCSDQDMHRIPSFSSLFTTCTTNTCSCQTLPGLEPPSSAEPTCSAALHKQPWVPSQALQCPSAVVWINPRGNIVPALNPMVWSQGCQSSSHSQSGSSAPPPPPFQAQNHSWLLFICICPPCVHKAQSLQHQDALSPTVKNKMYKNCICSTDLLSWSSTAHRRPGLL